MSFEQDSGKAKGCYRDYLEQGKAEPQAGVSENANDQPGKINSVLHSVEEAGRGTGLTSWR